MFIKGVSIYFTFFVVSLSGFGARIMLTSYNDFRNFPQVGMLSVGSMGKEPSTGTMAVVLVALSPEPNNPVFTSTTPVHCTLLPPGGAQSKWLKRGFFELALNRVPGLQEDSSLPVDFYSQMLCRFFFLVLVLWAGDFSIKLRPHTPK